MQEKELPKGQENENQEAGTGSESPDNDNGGVENIEEADDGGKSTEAKDDETPVTEPA